MLLHEFNPYVLLVLFVQLALSTIPIVNQVARARGRDGSVTSGCVVAADA